MVERLHFFYDNSGLPFAMSYNGTMYYYITNLQGDVVMMVDSDGSEVARYTYDPYGKILTATGIMADINPLRYRGYYYDAETGMYYLQSRYYDPVVGRFINADSYASTGQGFIGYNMFAYCGNDPVNNSDPSGESLVGAINSKYSFYAVNSLESTCGAAPIGPVATVAVLAVTSTILDRIAQAVSEAYVISSQSGYYEDYSVYFLASRDDPTGTIIYVGRVKTVNFEARMAYHATRNRYPVKVISGLNYDQCRAMEQAGMVFFHTINSANPFMNQIRGISPTNGNRNIYREALDNLVSAGGYTANNVIPASYILNLTENEFLNLVS